MKKNLLFLGALLPFLAFSQTTILIETFDSLAPNGTLAAQSSLWETWGGTVNEDPFVSNTYSTSPSNSVNVYNNGAGAYLHDVVLPFPSTYSTGVYEFKIKMYVPSGSGGYFNLGSVWSSGGAGYQYGIDIFLNADGSGFVSGNTGVFAYTQDSWTDVSIMVNLIAGTADVSVDGSFISQHMWGASSGLGVLDVFGIAYSDASGSTEVGSNFYIDDVQLIDWTGVDIKERTNAINVDVFPNPSNGSFSVSFDNLIEDNYNVKVLDLSGKIVDEKTIFISNQSIIDFQLELKSGIYFLSVSNEKNNVVKKLVVQ